MFFTVSQEDNLRHYLTICLFCISVEKGREREMVRGAIKETVSVMQHDTFGRERENDVIIIGYGGAL